MKISTPWLTESLSMTTKDKAVLVAFPFDKFSTSKVRPAVCLTEPIGPYRHVIFAFIARLRKLFGI
jgi:hypothetical protein